MAKTGEVAITVGGVEQPPDVDPGWTVPRHPSLAAALAAFQANRPTLTKTNPVDVVKDGRKLYSYSYADLADVEETVLPLLGAQGIAWHCHTEFTNGTLMLVCTLEHASGDMRSSVFPIQAKLTDPQGMGSYLTYFQRYALMMITGVHAAGEDDDGRRAQDSGRNSREEPPAPRQEQQERPAARRGTRQGAADDYARELLTKPLADLPSVWTNIEAGGHVGDKPTPPATQGILDHLKGAEIPSGTMPARYLAMATGTLANIAAFRLILDTWQAETFGSVVRMTAVADALHDLVGQQPRFADMTLVGGPNLSDHVAEAYLAMSRQAGSDPAQNDPPWVASGGPINRPTETVGDIGQYESGGPNTPYDVQMDQTHGARTVEPWDHPDSTLHEGDRPAVLEGT